jgi:predicted dehydrogenase
VSAQAPLRVAFLGCGFITRIHSRHLQYLRGLYTVAYASRDSGKAEEYRRRYRGVASYDGYEAAIADPANDAVVVAVPPAWHLDLTLKALAAGRHVLVEKPAFPALADYHTAAAARDAAGRVVIVGENDHYKPAAVYLRQLLRRGVIGDLLLATFNTVANKPKDAGDWRNDETVAGGDAFFEEGIHWLHFAGSLGPTITRICGFRPPSKQEGPDRRARTMLAAFEYDSGAAGTVLYSREVPSLLLGLRMSKLYGRKGVISFESNGSIVLVRRRGWSWIAIPGLLQDIRGYRAMYRDFAAAIRAGRQPEMSLERAIEDQRLMDQLYGSVTRADGR